MRYLITIFGFLTLSLIFVKTTFAAENLLPNSSFENGASTPENWSTSNGSGCSDANETPTLTFEWDSIQAQTGKHSLALKNISKSPQNTQDIKVNGSWMSSDYINVEPFPQKYTISVSSLGEQTNQWLLPILTACYYDNANNLIYQESHTINISYPFPAHWLWDGWTTIGWTIYYRSPSATKIKASLSSQCYSSLPCSGSIWFDNISLQPLGNITVHKFEDLNKNGTQDTIESNLKGWGISLYRGFDCNISNETFGGWTNANGNLTDQDIPFDDYSAKETFYYLDTGPPLHMVDAKQQGWNNTTPLCQNVTLDSQETTVNIGNFHGPLFPYLSQLDPTWKDLEYDHASSIGPFFCGTTIGSCGCAITSSAMLLKYYGITKSPDGSETNPDTLNTWLKQNSGYVFGALKWNSVAAYSVRANEALGTQKIRFVGVGNSNDFSTLDTDLTSSKPDILEEPGHFIVATEKNSPTYTISDPAYQSRQTLAAYQNSFLSMRRFEKTNTDLSALYISSPTPNDLLITDTLGRKTGRDAQSGQIFKEIPNSYYFLEPSLIDQTQQNTQTPDSGVNTLVIINPPQGVFALQSQSGPIDVSAYDTLGNIKVKNFALTSPDIFEINYSPNTGSDFSVFQKVKIEVKPQNLNKGNGVIPVVVDSDNNFNAQDVDFNSIRFTSAQIAPIKFPLLVQNGKDNKKDLQVFFFANKIPSDPNLCLTGITTDGLTFKGCDT